MPLQCHSRTRKSQTYHQKHSKKNIQNSILVADGHASLRTCNSEHHLKWHLLFWCREVSQRALTILAKVVPAKYIPKSFRSVGREGREEMTTSILMVIKILKMILFIRDLFFFFFIPLGHILTSPSEASIIANKSIRLLKGKFSYCQLPSAPVGSVIDCHLAGWLLKLRNGVIPKQILYKHEDTYITAKCSDGCLILRFTI